jgi:putative hydrolase of the HAD superfamily
MNKYKHLFFDLDRTLWDFDKNSKETLQDIFISFGLQKLGIPDFDVFYEHYCHHNIYLWELYRGGKIEKDFLSAERFYLTLADFGIENKKLSKLISMDYVEQSPSKTALFPFTHEVLDYLYKKYSLHVITNGFKEIQFRKLSLCGLEKYFNSVVVSEEAGCNKPDSKIFLFALGKNKAEINESIMIGDDLAVDVLAAKAIGMDQVYVNYDRRPHDEITTYEISSLKELTGIL